MRTLGNPGHEPDYAFPGRTDLANTDSATQIAHGEAAAVSRNDEAEVASGGDEASAASGGEDRERWHPLRRILLRFAGLLGQRGTVQSMSVGTLAGRGRCYTGNSLPVVDGRWIYHRTA